MARSIAIIGAGPAGLATAKAALEVGLVPTVFEANDDIGGVWRPRTGVAWPGLRLNLSRYTCCFSDLPWPSGTADFPRQQETYDYLSRFADTFDLWPYLRLGRRVSTVTDLTGFDGLVVASGFFTLPVTLTLPGVFAGISMHSGAYRGPEAFVGRRVIVVGMAFSGAEIAAELASADIEVTAVTGRAMWLLPRRMPLPGHPPRGEGPLVPWDLLAYRRSERHAAHRLPPAEANRRRAAHYQQLGTNPGALHPALWLDPGSPDPPYVVFAERLVELVARGRLVVEPGRAVELIPRGVRLDTGTEVTGDVIVWCTGYRPDLSFLTTGQLAALEFDPADRLQPLLLHQCSLHPDLPGIAFVGMYRGPYFAVMELQARWTCAVLSGQLAPPSLAAQQTGLAQARAVRARLPRPQFPYADYVGLADAIALELGVLPDLAELWEDPVIPAQYRLRGPGARPELAWPEITSVRRLMMEGPQ